MKTKTFKISLDVIMLIIYTFLTFGADLSGLAHEILGIAMGAIFLIHILINAKAFSAMTKSIRNHKATTKVKILVILDILLFFVMPVAIVSGVLISKDLLNMGFNWMIFLIHQISSYAGFAILILHLGVHAGYVLSYFKSKSAIGKAVLNCGLAVYMVAIMYFGAINSIDTMATINNAHTSSEKKKEDSEVATQSEEQATESIVAEDTSESDSAAVVESSGSDPTLDEYLSTLRCTGCGKACLLTSPRCNKGVEQQEQATNDYYSIYG